MPRIARRRWTSDDFDAMGWHDNAVHALRIEEGEHGEGELLLDIDYIEEWIPGDEHFAFMLCPATLQFHQVTALRIAIDYAGPSAGVCPFSLDAIEREALVYPNGYTSYRWTLRLNWPEGEIRFDSPGFTQTALAPSRRSERQSLEPSERGRKRKP
jgi:hypothetical protein